MWRELLVAETVLHALAFGYIGMLILEYEVDKQGVV